MSQNSGLAAVLAAITGKQPAGDTIARADHISAIEAAVTQAFGQGEAAGLKAAGQSASGERTRIKSILGSEEAKGREQFAQVYAFETDLSAEAAVTALKDKPKAEAPKGSRLDGRVPQPNVPAADAPKDGPKAASESWAGIVADLNKQHGRRSVA